MKKFFAFLKGLFKGLLDIFIIAIELLLCAGVVFVLVTNPLASPAEKKIVSVELGDPNGGRGLDQEEESVVAGMPSDAPLFLPDVEWVPPAWGPAKYWGYADKYSPTEVRRLPGYWQLARGPRRPVELSWWSPAVYYEVWNIPSLFVEAF